MEAIWLKEMMILATLRTEK